MNFSVDVNGELASTSEAVLRLEQAYKETFNKIEVIENCVSEKLHEKLELVNVTVENNAHDVKEFFEQKLEEYSKNLSEIVEENNVKVVDSVDNLKAEISARLEDFDEGQKSLKEQNNVISAEISTLGDDLKTTFNQLVKTQWKNIVHLKARRQLRLYVTKLTNLLRCQRQIRQIQKSHLKN